MAQLAGPHLHVIQVLLEEHAVISDALAVLQHLTSQLAGRGPVQVDDLCVLTTFFREYADTIHHRTEEDVLFPSVQHNRILRSMSQKLLTQHTMGRIFLGEMTKALESAESGRRGWRKRFVGSATAYHTLLTIHICDEDKIYFPRAERSLRRTKRVRLTASGADKAKAKWARRVRLIYRRHIPVDQIPYVCSDSNCQHMDKPARSRRSRAIVRE